jgi:hypothetical protein
MLDEDTMFQIMERIDKVLLEFHAMSLISIDEMISLKRALDVAADMWFETDE